MSACQYFRPGSLCRAGFPLSYSSACTGRTCTCCNRPNDKLPPCQDEDIDPRWLDDSGKPRHALKETNHGAPPADAQRAKEST